MHHDPTSASASFSTSSSQSPVSSSPSAASLASATTSLSSTSSSTSAATTSHSLSRVTVSVSTSASPALAPPSHPHNPSSAPVRHHPRRGTAGASTASVPCLTSSHIRPNVNRNADVLAIHQSFDLSKPYTPPSPSPPQSPSLPKSTALSSTHNKQSSSSPTGGSHSDRSVSLSQQLVSASVQEQYVSLKSQQTSHQERHPRSGSPTSMSRREKFDNSIVNNNNNNNNNQNKNKTNINHNKNNNSSIGNSSRNGLGIQTIDQQGDAIVMDHVLDQDSVLPSTQAADIQVSNSSREEHGRCKRRKSSSSRSSRHQMLSNDGSSSTRSRSKRSRSSKRRDKHRISNGGDGGDEREREGWQSSSRRSVARIHITEECCVEQAIPSSHSKNEACASSKMPPGDVSSLSSSIAPTSPGTTSASATPSPSSPISGSTCISASSLPSSVPSISPSPSKSETAHTTASLLLDSSLNPFPTVPDTLSDTSSSPASNSASSPTSPPSSPDQNEGSFSSSQPARTGIFLPTFLSSIRIVNSRPNPSIPPPQSSSKLELQPPKQPSPHSTTTSTSSAKSSSSRSTTTSSRSRQKDTTREHSVIVTDVRSINIRDISTVPTITSFNQKRSKRRSSSASHHLPVPSSSCTSASSSSSPHITSTSRRKRIKKSSHSTRTSRNHCSDSCGCLQSQGSPAVETSVESLTDLEHRHQASTTSQLHMESTGRIRTISESEVSVSDRTQPSHRIAHQQQQQQEQQRRSRQSSSHQTGQDPTAELTSHCQSQEPLSQPHSSLHIQHRLPPSSPQQTLHTHSHSHSHNHTPILSALNNSLPQRIQTHQDRDQQHTPHHKRQRSPQLQQMPFEAPSPITSSSSATASVTTTERLKRARHQSGEAYESIPDEPVQLDPAHTMAWHDKDSKDQSDNSKRLDAPTLNDTRNGSFQIPTAPTHAVQQDRTVVLQVRQPSRIHPFDNESSTPNMSRKSQDDRHHPLDGPVHTSLPAARSDVEPSIHPLDSEARKDTNLRQGCPSEGRHQEASSRIQPTPESTSHRTPTAPQHQSSIQQRPVPGASSQRIDTAPPKSVSASTATSRTQQQSSRPSGSNAVIPAAKPNPATLMLPITRDTLRELDLFEIFKNPQLRHDIVFDPHLQFRPNFDGERGLTKRREADRFWHEVGSELTARRAVLTARRDATTKMLNLAGLSASSPSSRMIQQQAQQMCPLPKAVLLPRLIDELREILLSLLPAVSTNQDGSKPSQQDAAHQENSERALLSSTLDPDLLLQELDHGVLDVHALFRYLGDSLKGHCAPMRDSLVESMVHTVVDFDEIVRGIRMCFEILEWMKLDIANHQLRTLRPWLLDNSIDFEQKYFTEHLGRGGSLQRTTEWFKKSWIHWESVKQSVIGKSSLPNVAAFPSSRRPSLAPSPTTNQRQDGSPQGLSPTTLSPAHPAINFKRRTSVVSTDIGENILDGVVNEGLLEMILRPHGSVNTMPETFELDHYRLLLFHNDFQDLTILCILLILFRQLAQNCWTQQDLVEIKKVVWLLLTDENANFGSNTHSAKASGGQQNGSSASSGSSGMKDIVIQIEFAARKVRERSVNAATTTAAAAAAGSRRSSLSPDIPIPTTTTVGLRRGSLASSVQTMSMATGSNMLVHHPLKNPAALTQRPLSAAALTSPTKAAGVAAPAVPSMSASDTNLLTAWLDNALCRTSTLYKLIQKRLLIHFRRWLYLHSCSSMLVLSASCASLASALSMSSSQGQADSENKGDDDDEETTTAAGNGQPAGSSGQNNNKTSTSSAKKSQEEEGGLPNTPVPAGVTPAPAPAPVLSVEEANKAAAEALAAKLSFNTTEMEAHGLTGLEDEMTALLEKIRAVSEFNKKVYGSWYRDLVKQGRAERWLDPSSTEEADSSASSSVVNKGGASAALSASNSGSNASTKTMA